MLESMLTKHRMDMFKKVINNRQSGLVVILEDIHDPHNAEAVFRTCDAFGIQNVYLVFDKESAFNPSKIGKATSSSANKWLTFHCYRSIKQCLEDLKKQNYKIFSTVCAGKSKSIFSTDFSTKKIGLLFGNEHKGLSDMAVKLSDYQINIPMAGMVQSLNVSVTAAICIYEVIRQGIVLKLRKNLSQKEKGILMENFLTR